MSVVRATRATSSRIESCESPAACEREHARDLAFRRGTLVAARAQAPDRGCVELDRLRREAGGEDQAEQRGGRKRVAERVVGRDLDAVLMTQPFEVVRRRERLEQPKRLERACDGGGL